MHLLIGYVQTDQTAGFERFLEVSQCVGKFLQTKKNPSDRFFRNLNRCGVIPPPSNLERLIRGLQGLSCVALAFFSPNNQFRRPRGQAHKGEALVIFKRLASERNRLIPSSLLIANAGQAKLSICLQLGVLILIREARACWNDRSASAKSSLPK